MKRVDLTEEEREWLAHPNDQVWPSITRKALSLIDQQASELARRAKLIELTELSTTAHMCDAAAAKALIEQVRIQVAPHRLNAFGPPTDDQATKAGWFKVALYLLQNVQDIVFAGRSAK